MNTDDVWNAVRDCTQELCDAPSFARIVDACPYFEGWWMVELAQRFSDGLGRRDGYRLAGFDPLAVSDERPLWQPDLLLHRRDGPDPSEIAWVELKQVNLNRKGPLKLPARVFRAICRAYCTAWQRARRVNLMKTATQFQAGRSIQNLTLDQDYQERPDKVFRAASHVAAAFMLAAIPLDETGPYQAILADEVAKLPPKCDRVERNQPLCELAIRNQRVAVLLFGLLEEFRWTES